MRWSVVAAVNDERVLQSSLLASPDLASATDVSLQRGFPSASRAYNEGLRHVRGDVVVFAHQDVYFPPGWVAQLERQIAAVEQKDDRWGVIGVCGTTTAGIVSGHLYSTGLSGVFGAAFDAPLPASTVDEMVIVIRRASALWFDERLDGFHLYGTDICLQARQKGLSSYIVSAFCVHNSNGLQALPVAFWKAYWSVRSRWKAQLPLVTTCTTLHRSMLRAVFETSRGILSGWRRGRSVGRRIANPAALGQHQSALESRPA